MNYIRIALIIAALISTYLWWDYGRMSRHWTYAVLAIIWLLSVAAFFAIRQLTPLPAITLNSISIGIYMAGIGICGGVAAAKRRALRLKRE